MVPLLVVASCGKVNPPTDQCATSAQCTDSAAPYCIDHRCEAACQAQADCTDTTAPVCASDGACVGCQAATDCTAQAPVCDATARACRGCSADAECPGGVCIEAAGTCAADADVAFVTMMGTDAGSCTRTAPCATLAFALKQIAGRSVVHVLGGALSITSFSLTAGALTFDGEDTAISTGTATTLTVMGSADVTIEGFRITAPPFPTGGGTPAPGLIAKDLSRLRLHGVTMSGEGSTLVEATGGAQLAIRKSRLGSLSQNSANTINCAGGTLLADQNTLEMTIIGNYMSCDMTVTRNRFESSRDGSVHVSGGRLVMENNLVIHRDGFNDSISVANLSSGSTIRFNTLVNTTAVGSDGAAMFCDNTAAITSNVFAYNSQHPIVGTGCETRYSVFDDRSLTSAGTGNQLTPIDSIFVNRGAGDYHLSATSAARGAAEPGQIMVTTDFDGHSRPDPAGSTADSGAFEVR